MSTVRGRLSVVMATLVAACSTEPSARCAGDGAAGEEGRLACGQAGSTGDGSDDDASDGGLAEHVFPHDGTTPLTSAPCDDSTCLLARGGDCFIMGDTSGDGVATGEGQPDERPTRTVCLSHAFRVDRYEVTVERYLKCADAGACVLHDRPWYWPPIPEDHTRAMVFVSWDDGVAFCRWSGGRLLTEAEWEYAARGGLVGRRFPWGDEYDPSKAYTRETMDGSGQPAPVGQYDPNGYGLYDMAGNVGEWAADEWDAWYYSSRDSPDFDPMGPDEGIDLHVLRDSQWFSSLVYARVSQRASTGADNYRFDGFGFRCAYDP